MTRALPMFPLGSVLFPHALLPLHVFETRYRALTEACLAGDGEFGVVLIERGSEVGGGDTRFTVGTVARILEAGRLPDGRYVLAAVGTRRLRVRRWLPEEPYPQADIEVLEDSVATDAEPRRA
ncbi:MAG TPA: LON peptidase substrate-binding domain-containing protein [Acidimicrobiia bacterium]|nr:LON peptidase substrate-binding domain-containing protein [Acidimicrobiia bacterium]